MITIGQKVKVHCTDTDVEAQGKILHIRPDGFDVEVGDQMLRLKKYKAGIYVGNHAGMEFVVKTL